VCRVLSENPERAEHGRKLEHCSVVSGPTFSLVIYQLYFAGNDAVLFIFIFLFFRARFTHARRSLGAVWRRRGAPTRTERRLHTYSQNFLSSDVMTRQVPPLKQ